MEENRQLIEKNRRFIEENRQLIEEKNNIDTKIENQIKSMEEYNSSAFIEKYGEYVTFEYENGEQQYGKFRFVKFDKHTETLYVNLRVINKNNGNEVIPNIYELELNDRFKSFDIKDLKNKDKKTTKKKHTRAM